MKSNVALVTGGASGIGQVHALRMAAKGTKVAVLDFSESALEQLAAQSSNIFPFHCDVTDLNKVQERVSEVVTTLGNIDRLVHCAAIMPTSPLPTQKIAEIQHIMNVNYGGTVNVTNTVLELMRAQGWGEIVIFSSLGASVPVLECGAYCAAKAAVSSYGEILIEENQGSGVHIMVVCPPLVDTPLLRQATESSNPKAVQNSIADKRFLSPDYIVDAVERGLQKKAKFLYPSTEAKVLAGLRRFFPTMLWKLIHWANK